MLSPSTLLRTVSMSNGYRSMSETFTLRYLRVNGSHHDLLMFILSNFQGKRESCLKTKPFLSIIRLRRS